VALVALDRCDSCRALRFTERHHLLGDHAACFRLGTGASRGKAHETKRHDALRLKSGDGHLHC
jgi:hypothetical protein